MYWEHDHLKNANALYLESVVEAAKAGIDGVRGPELLEEYFSAHPDAQVGVILHAGLEFAPGLLKYIDTDHMLFYSPKDSTRKGTREQFLVGTPNPERDLLLVDVDSAAWTAARCSTQAFEALGYDRNKMHLYLNHGLANFREDPLLVTIKQALQ